MTLIASQCHRPIYNSADVPRVRVMVRVSVRVRVRVIGLGLGLGLGKTNDVKKMWVNV